MDRAPDADDSAAFMVFTLYMIPNLQRRRLPRQVLFGIAIAAVYGVLLVGHVVYGLFIVLAIASPCGLRMAVHRANQRIPRASAANGRQREECRRADARAGAGATTSPSRSRSMARPLRVRSLGRASKRLTVSSPGCEAQDGPQVEYRQFVPAAVSASRSWASANGSRDPDCAGRKITIRRSKLLAALAVNLIELVLYAFPRQIVQSRNE
jgi:hypothetical protein